MRRHGLFIPKFINETSSNKLQNLTYDRTSLFSICPIYKLIFRCSLGRMEKALSIYFFNEIQQLIYLIVEFIQNPTTEAEL